jgi:hypothetical protein
MVEHARAIAEAFGRPLLIENIAAPLRLAGTMSETDFLNRLCERSGCGLSVDLTALAVNGRNHAVDPVAWLAAIEPERIVQIRLGSYSQLDGAWRDTNDGPVPEEVWGLAERVLASAPVRAAILERDRDFPPLAELEGELRRLRALARPVSGHGTNEDSNRAIA